MHNSLTSIVRYLKHSRRKAALAALALAVLNLAGACGKRKPPLPPTEKVMQRAEVTGFQRGNQVILSWKMPMLNAAEGSVLHIARADVYRLTERLDAPQSLSEEEFASRSQVVATIPLTKDNFGAKTLQYTDTLQFAGQPARIRYAIRFVNATGQRAAFSNFFLLEPAAKIAAAPGSLSTALSQDAVRLNWTPPAANVDGTSPANLLGYNIYRAESEKSPAKLLNQSPVSDVSYEDRFFDFEKEYFYFVRAVSLGADAAPTESSESNIVKIKPVDTFAPSAPAAITIAATPISISIFFPANPEPDVEGYSVYRSTDANLPKDQWTLLTKELLNANTYQDGSVEAGKTYFYYVTATDKYKNVSETSEVVSETVP
ncbi:MAG: fibronectin type III domain-containing protein [Pyrinomonadaceae bacterium]